MKLKEHLEWLNDMVKKRPKLLELEVIYSVDDEGNTFSKAIYGASPGYFKGSEFIPEEEYKECPKDYEDAKMNSVCIN